MFSFNGWIQDRKKTKLERLLKPCPFCGGEAMFHDHMYDDGRVGVECVECGIGLPAICTSYEKAAELWNRRVDG